MESDHASDERELPRFEDTRNERLEQAGLSTDEGHVSSSPVAYTSANFLEWFFGVSPSQKVYVLCGFVLVFAVFGGSIALGYLLVDTTQVLPAVRVFRPERSVIQCTVQWMKPPLAAQALAEVRSCPDASYWDALDPSLFYGTTVITIDPVAQPVGVCAPMTMQFSDTDPSLNFNWTQWRSEGEVFFYSSTSCEPHLLEFTVSYPGCDIYPTYTVPSNGQLDAFRGVCQQSNGTGSEFADAFDFVTKNPDAGCTTTIQAAQVIRQCSGNYTGDALPSSRQPQTILFSDASTLFPALLQQLRSSVYQSTLYQTATALVFSEIACIDKAAAAGVLDAWTPDTDAYCSGITWNACDRLCALMWTLRPDLISPIQFSHFPLNWSANATDCRAKCAAASQADQYALFVNQLLTYFDFRTLRDWVLQFLTRCIATDPNADGVIFPRVDLFTPTTITCTAQTEVPLSDNSVNLNRFVNVISWIGTFQMLFASSFLMFLILRYRYYTRRQQNIRRPTNSRTNFN